MEISLKPLSRFRGPLLKKAEVDEYVAALAQVCGAMELDLKTPGPTLRQRLRRLQGREKAARPKRQTTATAKEQERIQTLAQSVPKEGQSEWTSGGLKGPRWTQTIQLPASSENSPSAVDEAFYRLEKTLIESLPPQS